MKTMGVLLPGLAALTPVPGVFKASAEVTCSAEEGNWWGFGVTMKGQKEDPLG